jgi:MFS family permease
MFLCLSAAVLNIVMLAIAWRLEENEPVAAPEHHRHPRSLEWRVLALSLSLFLYSFGYGGITSFSAMYADANGVSPRSIYLTMLAVVILVTRPLAGRLGDTLGYKRVFVPCLVLITIGLACLAVGGTLPWMITSAIVFGAGFGTAYPVFVGYIMTGVSPARRGAGFGAILAAFDTGIGTGSTTIGFLISRIGFANAFGVAAALSALALPYFIVMDRRLNPRRPRRGAAGC